MKKLLILASALMLMVLSCGNSGSESKSSGNAGTGSKKYRIGITQIVSHPALDSAREGFKAAFKEVGVNAEFDEKNANGETTNSNLIANNFVSSKEDLIFAIATNAAQSVSQATNDIPVVFAAITDPQSAGILKNNVTGVSDRMDVKQQLELLKKIGPNIKNVGVIYNSSEQNSKIQVEDLKKSAKELGLNIVEKSVVQANEIPQTVDNLVREADAIYLPTDNLVVSGMNLIASEAVNARKPVVVSENSSVKEGALFTMGLDYYALGKRTGEMAIEILKGKPVSQIPFETSKQMKLYVNSKTAQALGLDLKNPAFSGAEFVGK